MPREIHVTDRQNFKRCRRRWNYECIENLKPATESLGALWFGRGMHYALADHYRGNSIHGGLGSWYDQVLTKELWANMSTEQRREVEEIRALQTGILSNYVEHYKEVDKEWQVVAVEKAFRHRIPGTHGYLVGTLDLLVKWRGRLWVVDHKNLTDFADPQYLELDDQMTAYMWLVAQEYGVIPAGAIYNQLRKRIPRVPEPLKSGKGLSKDKSISTNYATYLKAIYDNGFNPAEYVDILEVLKNQEDKFFRRESIARNKNELITFEEQLQHEFREMNSRNTRIFHNPTKECVYDCSYRVLCKAQNEKGDTDGLKQTLYVVSEGRSL